jgi:RNA polymerase sigma-70 factor, ECF subfamily
MGFALPDIPTEDMLLSRASRGEQAAVTQIYELYFPSIYRFVRLQVGDLTVAEDIASEVFIKFMDTVGGRTGPRHSLRGWLFQVARNEINQHYGKVRQFPTETLDEWIPSASDHDPEIQFMQSIDRERAQQALRTLVPEQQEVLLLRFVESLSLQETADVMNKSASAIKSLQFRAIESLRRILSNMKLEQYG